MASDPVLQFIIAAAEAAGHAFSLTVTVDGTIMTGDLTTLEEYREWLDRFVGRERAAGAGNAFSAGGTVPPGPVTAEDVAKRAYVHLRNVAFGERNGDTNAFAADVVWRVRVDRIDGFTIGRSTLP